MNKGVWKWNRMVQKQKCKAQNASSQLQLWVDHRVKGNIDQICWILILELKRATKRTHGIHWIIILKKVCERKFTDWEIKRTRADQEHTCSGGHITPNNKSKHARKNYLNLTEKWREMSHGYIVFNLQTCKIRNPTSHHLNVQTCVSYTRLTSLMLSPCSESIDSTRAWRISAYIIKNR